VDLLEGRRYDLPPGQEIEHVYPFISESDVGDLKSAEAAPSLGGNAAMVGDAG
jgi:hypothetical protein